MMPLGQPGQGSDRKDSRLWLKQSESMKVNLCDP